VSEGLDRVLDRVAVRTGYVEGSLGATSTAGAYGRLEAGLRPWERVGAFGFVEHRTKTGETLGGVGARYVFDF